MCVFINEQLIHSQNYFIVLLGFASERFKRQFLISSVCTGNIMLWLGKMLLACYRLRGPAVVIGFI
jgi:hypothetical protein